MMNDKYMAILSAKIWEYKLSKYKKKTVPLFFYILKVKCISTLLFIDIFML